MRCVCIKQRRCLCSTGPLWMWFVERLGSPFFCQKCWAAVRWELGPGPPSALFLTCVHVKNNRLLGPGKWSTLSPCPYPTPTSSPRARGFLWALQAPCCTAALCEVTQTACTKITRMPWLITPHKQMRWLEADQSRGVSW